MLDARHIQLAGIPADEFAELMVVLSDPSRIILLSHLAVCARAGEMVRVVDCVPWLGVSQPTVSYHLKCLRAAGLVTSELRGKRRYHALNHARFAELSEALLTLSRRKKK